MILLTRTHSGNTSLKITTIKDAIDDCLTPEDVPEDFSYPGTVQQGNAIRLSGKILLCHLFGHHY